MLAEPDGVHVHRVQVGEGVEQRLGGGAAALVREQFEGQVERVQDHALDAVHDVERGTVDRDVRAQSVRGGHGDAHRAERGDGPVLAGHVVGGGQHMAERRAAENHVHPVRVGDAVGEVGVPPGQQRPGERCPDVGDVLGEPRRHRGDVDPGGLRGLGGGRCGVHVLRS